MGTPLTFTTGPAESREMATVSEAAPVGSRPYKTIAQKKEIRKSRRMRSSRSSTRTGHKAHGMESTSSEDDDDDEVNGYGWMPPPLATDAMDAGYGGSGGGYNPKAKPEVTFARSESKGFRGGPSKRGGSSHGGGSREDRQGKEKKKPIEGDKKGTSGKKKKKSADDESDGGTSLHNSDRSESQPSIKWSMKHEFSPRSGARKRHELIFKEQVVLTFCGEPGENLDTILRDERASTPGFTLGHAAALYGFDFGIQPVPIWNIINEGGGQLRTVEEANTNKAIISSIKKLEIRLTRMSQLVNVCYNLTSIFGRWYKSQLVEIAAIIDQEIGGAVLAEGIDAPQAVVDGYVALVEGVLGDVACTITNCKKEEFDEVMVKEIDKVRFTLSPASKLHQRTVYQAHKKVMGEVVSRRHVRGGGVVDKEEKSEERPKKKQRGAGGHDSVPSFVVDALKVDGKSLCVGNALDRGCLRGSDKCRFMHSDLPSDVSVKVTNWIKDQNKKKTQ